MISSGGYLKKISFKRWSKRLRCWREAILVREGGKDWTLNYNPCYSNASVIGKSIIQRNVYL